MSLARKLVAFVSGRFLPAPRGEVIRLRTEVERLHTRVEQLVGAHEANEKTAARLRQAQSRFAPGPIAAHVTEAVAAATLVETPCPHLVITDLLPETAYDELVKAVPPRLFFEHLEHNRQELMVPPELAPAVSRAIWRTFYDEVVVTTLVPALIARFEVPLEQLIRRHWPDHDSPGQAGADLDVLMSRLLLRRPGYEIKPHRDPRWAFLTCLVYLPPRKSDQLFGTDLCRVLREREPDSHGPLWLEDADVEVTTTVPGHPNSAVVFLNSTGAHRASIPPGAPPETERYIYQLQLGPLGRARRRLLKALPAVQAARWRR